MKRLLPLILAFAACGPAPADTIVVLGSWGAAPGAYSTVYGARLAVELINQEGGIGGRPLRILEVDDRYGDLPLPELAPYLVRLSDSIAALPEVLAVIGHTHSIPTSIAGTVYRGRKPFIVPGHLPPYLGSREEGLLGMLNAGETARLAAERLHTRGYDRVAVLFTNSPGGRAPVPHFRDAFPGRIVSEGPLFGASPADLEPYFDFYDREGVDAVIYFGTPAALARILDLWQRAPRDWLVVGVDAFATLQSQASSRPLLDGALFANSFTPKGPDGDSDFETRYLQLFGRAPDAGALVGHDAVMTVAAAHGGSASPRELIDRLARLDRRSAPLGLTGPVYFRSDGERAGAEAEMVQVGTLRPVSRP